MALRRFDFDFERFFTVPTLPTLPPAVELLDLFWTKVVPAVSEALGKVLPRLERLGWECAECVAKSFMWALIVNRRLGSLWGRGASSASSCSRVVSEIRVGVVQGLIVGVQLCRRQTKGGPSQSSVGLARLAAATTLEEWRKAASVLDASDGGQAWRAEGGKGESLVDAKTLRVATEALEACRRSRSLHHAMYRMRGDLLFARDAHGLGSPRLYERAWLGAPVLVEKYVEACVWALNHIVESDDATVPTDARLAFFNECRHAHGRTALLLSGGAGLGTYHLGVVSALRDSGTLPRVISGASAGSIVAATVCARTDGELEDIYDAVLEAEADDDAPPPPEDTIVGPPGRKNKKKKKKNGSAAAPPPSPTRQAARIIFRLDFFRWRSVGKNMDQQEGFSSTSSSSSPSAASAAQRNKGSGGGLMCGDHLAAVIQANVGDWTFQEAFDRTGRILNIPVKAHDSTGDSAHVVGFAPPRLLNYLTAPHVIVWSASRASCAVPGMFSPSPLLVRAADGTIGFESSTLYVDGSMGADLPFEIMRTLFNCNHFICSQTNPHAAILGDVALSLVGATAPGCAPRGFQAESHSIMGEARRWFATTVMLSHATLRFVKAQLKTWVVEGTHLISDVATLRATHSVTPSRVSRYAWPRGVHEIAGWGLSLLTQPYEGTPSDVTIVPWAGAFSIFTAVLKTLANPERGAPIIDILIAGKKNTWREMAKIEMHTAVERALELGVQRLRRRLVRESQRANDDLLEEDETNDANAGIGRTPSFYTSPSILQLSGLAVVDPLSGPVLLHGRGGSLERRPSLTNAIEFADLIPSTKNKATAATAATTTGRRRSWSDAGATTGAMPMMADRDGGGEITPPLENDDDDDDVDGPHPGSSSTDMDDDSKRRADDSGDDKRDTIFGKMGDQYFLVRASSPTNKERPRCTSAEALARPDGPYFKTSTMANFYYRCGSKSENDVNASPIKSFSRGAAETDDDAHPSF